MITASIAKWFENEGIGIALLQGNEANADIFVERITLDASTDGSGIWIESRGFPMSRGTRETAAFDVYARTTAPYTGNQKLKEVRRLLKSAYGTTCQLPAVTGVPEQYVNVTIEPTSNIDNIGQDAMGRTVWVMSGQVSYNEQLS